MVEISVILPIYNCERYIEKSINSILNQTFEDFEIICVDDGSNDNTPEILNRMASSDSRIKVYSQENQGASVARNNALKEVTGNYVYFFDADDYLVEEGLEKMHDNALNNDSDIVIFRFSYYQDNEFIRHDRNFELEKFFTDVDFNNFSFHWSDIREYILRVNVFAPWFKLYKKEFLDKYDCFEFPPGLEYNDVPFQIETILKSSSISFIPEFLYQYNRNNPISITNNPKNGGKDIFSIVDIVENFLRDEGLFEELEDDFYLFKVKMITRHMDVNTQEYLDLAKKELAAIDLENNELIKNVYLYRAESVLDSKFPEEYHYKQEIYKLNKKIKKLNKNNKKLKNENKKFDKEIKKLNENNEKLKNENKKLNKKNREILNSNSWKITKPLRKLKQSIKR